MSTTVQNAAKGQRGAMETLYEENKQKIYFIAHSLLGSRDQAISATITTFREAWNNLVSAGITTNEKFTDFAVSKVVDYCKGKAYKKNPKALRIPFNKNFTIPANLMVNDNFGSELDYLLAHLPPTQKYIFVMHTAGEMELMQIARIMKFDSKTTRTAIEAEAGNFERLQRFSQKGFSSTYDEIIEEMKQKEADTTVPSKVDEQVAAMIDAIAGPIEAKAKKQKYTVTVICVLLCACIVIGVLIGVATLGGTDVADGSETSTSATENTVADGTSDATDATDGSDATEDTAETTDGSAEETGSAATTDETSGTEVSDTTDGEDSTEDTTATEK